MNSLWRDSANSWRSGVKQAGTSSYDGIVTASTVTGTYTRRSGDAFITINKVNYLNQFADNGRYSFSWIGKYMNETQRTNFIIRITDLLLAFNRNIFTK